MIGLGASVCEARIKLVALPERGATVIRLDNPAATLIEEEAARGEAKAALPKIF